MTEPNNNNDTRQSSAGLDCRTAREQIDSLTSLSVSDQRQLDEHLAICPNCAAEASIEQSLREVVAPCDLASPSAGFQAALMIKLDLAPATEPVTKPLVVWGWVIGGFLTLTAVLMNYSDNVAKYAYKGIRFVLLSLADVMFKLDALVSGSSSSVIGKVDGYLFSLLGEFAKISGSENLLVINLMFASLAVLSGVIAVGLVNRD